MFDILQSLVRQHVTITLKCGNEYSGTLTLLTRNVLRLERTRDGKTMRRTLLVKEVLGVDQEVKPDLYDERDW